MQYYLQQRGVVEEEESLEDVVQMVEPIPVLQVLTDVEQVQKLGDVAIRLDMEGHGVLVGPGH